MKTLGEYLIIWSSLSAGIFAHHYFGEGDWRQAIYASVWIAVTLLFVRFYPSSKKGA